MRTIESINLIWRRPGCRRGRPTVVGRGLKVKTLVADLQFDPTKPTPEEIAKRYVATTAQVYAALTYYHLHKAEVDADIAADFRFNEILLSQGLEAAHAEVVPIAEPEAASIVTIALISRDTDVHHGSPCIDGTHVRVADIVVEKRQGLRDPAPIAEKYDLSLAQVYCALAYYHERQTEIDAEIEYASGFDERWKAEGLVPV